MGKQRAQNLNALNNRVWYVRGGVRVDRSPEVLADGKFSTDPSQSMGDETPTRSPDPDNFQADREVGTVRGGVERGTLAVANRQFPNQLALLNDMARDRCQVDFYGLSGKCGNAMDFSHGGEKVTFFKDGKLSTRGYENYGAFATDENNPTNEMVDINVEDFYEMLYVYPQAVLEDDTVREIMTVDVWEGDECDECPNNVLLATMLGVGATPGTSPRLLWSDDDGLTTTVQDITSMFSNERVADSAIIGGYLVLASNTGNELHYTRLEEVLIGQNEWLQNAATFEVGGEPLAMWAVGPGHLWVVGNGGYIYFFNNFRLSGVVQSSGDIVTQNLLDVHAFDRENVLIVGENNTVLFTRNGGDTWEQANVGPAAGVDLGACLMWNEDVWQVGEGPGGNGRLWYTLDGGYNWTEKTLPIDLSRIHCIEAVDEADIYMVGVSGGQSYGLRTKTAGYEWLVIPDVGAGTFPDNSLLSDIAVYPPGKNTVFFGGIADNGTAGLIVKASA